MDLWILFLANVLAIAGPLAIFEIAIEEKGTGWGASFAKDRWYGKILYKDNPVLMLLARVNGIPYIIGYHLLMFGVIVPGILTLEYFTLTHNLLFLVGVYITNFYIEDLLWFAFNWKFDALSELLKGPNGSIWWHGRWLRISKNKYLPASYFGGLALTIAMLVLASR